MDKTEIFEKNRNEICKEIKKLREIINDILETLAREKFARLELQELKRINNNCLNLDQDIQQDYYKESLNEPCIDDEKLNLEDVD
jgi:hypothetical protein